MTDPAIAAAGLTIPDETQKKFSDILKLIVASESMNTEERQYWINILPIMTPEQLKNLQDILQSERTQLQEIDAKYAKEIERIGETTLVKKVEEARQQRREQRKAGEQHGAREDAANVEDLLKKIDQA